MNLASILKASLISGVIGLSSLVSIGCHPSAIVTESRQIGVNKQGFPVYKDKKVKYQLDVETASPRLTKYQREILRGKMIAALQNPERIIDLKKDYDKDDVTDILVTEKTNQYILLSSENYQRVHAHQRKDFNVRPVSEYARICRHTIKNLPGKNPLD